MGTLVSMKQVFGVALGDDYRNDDLFVSEDYRDELFETFPSLNNSMFDIEVYGNESHMYPVLVIARSAKGCASEASPLKIDGIFLPTKHELAALEKVCKEIGVTFTPRNMVLAYA